MKIVFFGSAHFAVPALEGLIRNKHKVLCVVTQPDKKKGRHLHLGATDVKQTAIKAGLNVFQPVDINTSQSVRFLTALDADIFIIVAYGQLLSQEVLDIPKIFPINIHASLLPKYRGAAPINWAIIKGEKFTGVTIMQVTRKMDSGAIIAQRETEIKTEDDAVSVEERLRQIGAELLLKMLPDIKENRISLKQQDDRLAIYAPKLKKSDGLIDWNNSVTDILNLIRGTRPWPGAFTHYNGKLLKIHKAELTDVALLTKGSYSAGEILNISKKGINVATGKGVLLIQELQIEGKRSMAAEEFISGHKISPGFRFI